jgi:hypothetical protein
MPAHAVQPLAVAAASDPGQPDLVEQELEVRLICELRRRPVAATGRLVRLERSAGAAEAVQHVGDPAAADFFPEALPADPVEMARAFFARPLPDHAAAPGHRATGNGNSAGEYPAAARPADSAPPNTFADRPGAVPALEQNGGSICPIRADAAPSHCPNDRPSVVMPLAATRENTREDSGSSARGHAGRTAAQNPGLQVPTARCTRNSRTSYPFGKPSTCHRKRRNSN